MMKIAIIGCGVIGSALARHFADDHQVLLCDHTYEKSSALAQEIGGKAYKQASEAIEKAEMVVLAFKPKDLTAFAKEQIKPGTLVMSVLAGTSVALLQKHFPKTDIVRILPNLPMICGKGVIGLVEVPGLQKSKVESLLKGLGLLHWLSEDRLEALSALAGSGPGFVFLLIQGMIEAGISLGFSPEDSREYVLKTIEGSVALLQESGKSPEELKRNVASPGGTTEAGLKVLEAHHIRELLKKTYQATLQRAKEFHL